MPTPGKPTILALTACLVALCAPRTAHADEWAEQPAERRWAAIVGVSAGLSTFGGVAAAIVANAYSGQLGEGPRHVLATRTSAGLFLTGAVLAAVAVPLGIVRPRARRPAAPLVLLRASAGRPPAPAPSCAAWTRAAMFDGVGVVALGSAFLIPPDATRQRLALVGPALLAPGALFLGANLVLRVACG